MSDIHAIILTKNESQHIARCIESLAGQADHILVVDSGSTDDTVAIAKSLGAEVVHNDWVNYAVQLNFGIDHVRGRGGWVLRIDADEYFDPASTESLKDAVTNAAPTTGALSVDRRVVFMGRRIRHGSIEPNFMVRLWRNGQGHCEARWMDEHVVVEGDIVRTGVVITDHNLNPLTWWTEKHNHYASREAIDILNRQDRFIDTEAYSESKIKGQKIKRFLKEGVYLNTPATLRTLFYFLYRYVLRLGFLDGRPGFYFHVLQGFWYRTLVDAKITEIRRAQKAGGMDLVDAIRQQTGIDPIPPSMTDRS